MDQAAAVPSTPSATSESRGLLACGAVAGPLFLVVAFGQALMREGFDLARHPLSLLSLGDLGWIQIANFIVAGLLFTACAIGMWRVMDRGSGGTWGPRLMGVFGMSLIVGGVFLSDPAFGFPPGTPPGTPDELSWHGIVHGIAPVVGFLALVVASFVFARRYSGLGERGWAVGCALVGVVVLLLSAWPNLGVDPGQIRAAVGGVGPGSRMGFDHGGTAHEGRSLMGANEQKRVIRSGELQPSPAAR